MLRTVAEHVDVADTETVSSRCPRIASVAYQRTHEQQTNRKHEPRSVLVFFSILQIMDFVLQVAKGWGNHQIQGAPFRRSHPIVGGAVSN